MVSTEVRCKIDKNHGFVMAKHVNFVSTVSTHRVNTKLCLKMYMFNVFYRFYCALSCVLCFVMFTLSCHVYCVLPCLLFVAMFTVFCNCNYNSLISSLSCSPIIGAMASLCTFQKNATTLLPVLIMILCKIAIKPLSTAVDTMWRN